MLDDIARTVNEEFKELFMSGFDKSEYHYEAVLHQDTANTHIHIRIPTKNLVTDTQLRLYYHDRHKNFINSIRDYLILKHELPQPKQENKQVISNENKKERLIQQQRTKQGRKSFDFNKKKGRDEAKKYIANYIVELHESGLIEDFEGLKEVIRGLDADIVNIGNDITGDFNYFTVQDKETGKKIRLIGEIYNAEFWEFKREDRTAKIRDNRVPRETNRRDEENLKEAKQRLDGEISKREEEIRKRYEPSRRRSRILQSSRFRQKNDNNTDSNPSYRLDCGSNIYEMANKRATEHHTEQSSSTRKISKREDIDDRIRATIDRRTGEREATLKKARELFIRDPREIQEEFGRDKDRVRAELDGNESRIHAAFGRYEKIVGKHIEQDSKSIFQQAQQVVRGRQEQRAIRDRIGKTLERVGKGLEGITNSIYERFRDITEKFQYFDRESENLIESAKEYQRELDRQNKPADSYSYGMKM